VLISAALGVGLPGAGRRADAADAILITLAILVFSTGASMTFSEMGAIRAAARRLTVVLTVTTVALPVLAWLASRLVSGVALRGGILSAGVAPAEVASVALTGLAGGEVVLAAGLLAASTILTVLLAGPILSIAGAHSSASPLGLLATLALVVALPLVAGSAMRSLDPFGGREQAVMRVLGTVSLLVLLWEVASQLHLGASDLRALLALLAYLAGGIVLGWLLAIGAPPGQRTAIVLPTAMRDFAVAAGIAASAFGAEATALLGLYGLLVLIFGTIAAYTVRRRALQWLTDPLPAPRLVVDRPHQEGSGRVGQFGDDPDQLAVKVVRPVLLIMRSVPGDRHDLAVPADQPDRDVAVVVQARARDIPGANDLSALIVRDPYVHIHACLLRSLSPSAGYPLQAIAAGYTGGSTGLRGDRGPG
jgi:predicted Na+-dependent transporter